MTEQEELFSRASHHSQGELVTKKNSEKLRVYRNDHSFHQRYARNQTSRMMNLIRLLTDG